MDANYLQKRMNELQQSSEFSSALGKLMSGKAGYKPVIETRHVDIRCTNCKIILDDGMKFCPECGTKVEK